MSFGDYLGDITKEPALNIGNLVYSGKIMGLCSYGNVNQEWLPYFEEYYRRKPDGLNYLELLKILGEKTGLTFDRNNRLSEQTSWDVAKTSQVIVVSHLAQVAVWAQNHLVVEKSDQGDFIESSVFTVTDERRKVEVARLLSGQEGSDSAREHAAELLELAGN